VFRNVGIYTSDVRELPKRKHTTFRTRRKFEIKKTGNVPAKVILSRVRVAVEKQQVLHILSVCLHSLGCPPCTAHTPHCYLWTATDDKAPRNVQRPNQPPIQCGCGRILPQGVKRRRHGVYPSRPSNVEVKMSGYTVPYTRSYVTAR
jgi:hypothetical protein